MFEVLGVIDLRGGFAVRAREGRRAEYAPIDTVAGTAIRRGDAESIARVYVERMGVKALYVADLDAIEGREPQRALVRSLAAVGVPLWLDAGIASVDDARCALACGASRAIVGLETLRSFDALKDICHSVSPDRVAFSLDLRDGTPVTTLPALAWQRPEEIVRQAIDAGVSSVVVVDLARVGTGRGLDLELGGRLKALSPSLRLFAGGGIQGPQDLVDMRGAGCDGALVASALLDGRITL
jgi:phosphoribosylformimino-5-aminoimidazole carboxamide ribotide isomerase